LPTPSAPPLEAIREEEEKKNQLNKDEDLARKIQEQEDEKLAGQYASKMQEHEDARLASEYAESQPAYPNLNQRQMEEDEQLARLLQDAPLSPPRQEEPAQGPPQPQLQPQPQQNEGFFATLGRGLRNAYNLYQQYSAQQNQMNQDEALARQLQREEMSRGPVFEVASPNMGRRANYPNFYNYDEDIDEDEMFREPTSFRQETPLTRLREVNSVFRSMGAPPEHPLLQHLHEMMNQSQMHMPPGGHQVFFFPANLPAHRYRYPNTVFQRVRGVENLPPELYQMMQGESDTSYESLLQLAERLQPVSRGASTEQIDQLPTRVYTEGSMPAEEAKCGVCLSDYEKGEELRTLPGCVHSFHKECIDKWLQINKVCPVCRHEITQDTNSSS
jgi:hypothetical protein